MEQKLAQLNQFKRILIILLCITMPFDFLFAKKKMTSSDFVQIKGQKIKIKDLNKTNIASDSILPKKELPKYNFTKNEFPQLINPVSPATLTNQQWISLLTMQKPYLPTKSSALSLETQPLENFKLTPIPVLKEAHLNIANIESVSQQEYKLVEALIILELKENDELALALLSEIINDPHFQLQGRWNLSQAAAHLGLRQESIHQLLQIEKLEKADKNEKNDTKEWTQNSIQTLVEQTKTSDTEFASQIYNSVLARKIDMSSWAGYAIAISKSLIDDKKLQEALSIVQSIPETSHFKTEGQFLKALIEYRSNQIAEAIVDLQDVLARIDKDKSNASWDIKSLAALTLGRIYFQKEDYKQAFNEYQKIDKNNALWLPSLIESAWTQILTKDFEGAAGNMFSLHTDFFKGAYQPESYIVRTVSYLNLCQYGDSMTVLQQFLRKYSHADKTIDLYLSQFNKDQTYETVKKLLLNPRLKEVNGLPRSLIIEMARDDKFVDLQKKINFIEDEVATYDKILNHLKDKEKNWVSKIEEIKKRQIQIKNFLKENHDEDQKISLEKEEATNIKKIDKLKLLQEVSHRAYTLLQAFQKDSMPRLQAKKDDIKKRASLVLHEKLQFVSKDLKHWLEQSELLHYEIYSGAGEHLRYQMGNTEEKEVAQNSTDVKTKKAEAHMQWDFHGEIWEDEIGNFRSSLKNVCPVDEKVTYNEK